MSSSMSSLAVCVQDACKSYGKKPILKNLCMEVSRGHIYGLLGASGCGKTTLLSCIVGRKNLSSGEVWVLNGKPGAKGSGIPGPKVGYMPQDIALVGELTIKDSFFYFGRIMNMSEKLIGERLIKLSNLLDLPPEDRYLKNCSGGQQRRVSFAVSMIHMPELLILDEPTAGVDPILRERIWDFLVELTTQEKMAVIITTHYIEETRQANMIGLMRDGRLLAQESPMALLSMFQKEHLEDVFYILSQRQEQGIETFHLTQRNNIPVESNTNVSMASFDIDHGSTDVLTTKSKSKEKTVSSYSMNGKRMKALMDKNWKQFHRNVSGVAFSFLFPILEVLAFFLAVGGDVKQINLAIVNDESMSCANYTKIGTAIPYNFSDCHFVNLDCRFLTYLDDPMIEKVKYDSLPVAMDAVMHGKAVGVLYMASNFTESLEVRLHDVRNADKEVVSFGQIQVWLDLSNRQIGLVMKYKLYSLYMDFQKDIFTDCKYDTESLDFFHLETLHGHKDESYDVFMVPGVVLTILFFMATIQTAQTIITDRCEGIWDRTAIAGVSSLEITITHFILQAGIVAFHTLEVFVITFLIFGIEYVGQLWTMFLLAYLQGIAGLSYGFWISVVSYDHSMANIMATGSFYGMILICGLMWPLEGMPVFLQWISKCLPFTVAINSFRNVMKKGWTLSYIEVASGLGMEVLWIAGLLAISTILMNSKR